MELNYLDQVPLGGFNYDNSLRNTALMAQTKTSHKTTYTKTGTTICGCVFNVSGLVRSSCRLARASLFCECEIECACLIIQGGVALAADTRATAGSIVADKNCEKLHKLAPNIYCAGAGTAADCDHVTGKHTVHLPLQDH